MTDTFTASLVGAITAVLTSIIASWVSIRAIRAEHKAKYHSALMERQITSCENLWETLVSASRTVGNQRLIKYTENGAIISVECSKKIYDDLVNIFTSSSGLYFSKRLRQSLFKLRDFLHQEIILKSGSEKNLQWSKTKANELDGYVQNLRNEIRYELGLEDLKVAKSNRPS